jgi:hypothetical protein
MPPPVISDDNVRVPDMASLDWNIARVLGKRRREGGEPSTSDEEQVQDNVQEQVQDNVQVQVQDIVQVQVQDNVQVQVQGNVQEQVQDHVQEQVQDHVQEQVQDHVQDQVRLLLMSDCDLPVCDRNNQGISY